MRAVLSILFAVLGAVSNAFGTVFQRRAAMTVPQSRGFRIGLMWDLIRNPVWLSGIGGVIVAAIFQAIALATGPLAIVQPIFVLELPCTLLIGGIVFSRPMSRAGWGSVACVVVGLGVALAAAAPAGGTSQAPFDLWVLALTCCGGMVVTLCAFALRCSPGGRRAALLGLATAITYSLTAALLKSATDTLDRNGVGAFFSAWQTYVFALCGATGLFLLENAMQAGPLVASQPALTLGDALISLSLGVVLYNESVRTGWWLAPEIVGAGLVALGVHGMSRRDIVATLAPDSALPATALGGLGGIDDDVAQVGAARVVERPAAGDQAQLRSGHRAVYRVGGKLVLGIHPDAGDLEGHGAAVGPQHVDPVPCAQVTQPVEHRRPGHAVHVTRDHRRSRLPRSRSEVVPARDREAAGNLERTRRRAPQPDEAGPHADSRNRQLDRDRHARVTRRRPRRWRDLRRLLVRPALACGAPARGRDPRIRCRFRRGAGGASSTVR